MPTRFRSCPTLVLLTLALAAPAYAGDIYSWRTEDGGYAFADDAEAGEDGLARLLDDPALLLDRPTPPTPHLGHPCLHLGKFLGLGKQVFEPLSLLARLLLELVLRLVPGGIPYLRRAAVAVLFGAQKYRFF